MNFLTADQRSKAIDMLALAPDEVLLSAMVEFRKVRHFEEGMKANVNDMLGELSGDAPKNEALVSGSTQGLKAMSEPEVGEIATHAIHTTPKTIERKNVSPGAPSIGKIGTGTKDEILLLLRNGVQPPKKFTEHAKLLWSRNEVQFDGSTYFL